MVDDRLNSNNLSVILLNISYLIIIKEILLIILKEENRLRMNKTHKRKY